MVSAHDELKIRAELLNRRVSSGDAEALARLRAAVPGDEDLIRRKHCLAAIAREHGFSSWEHAVRVSTPQREAR